MKHQLLALAERVEKAEGPDRELDIEILFALDSVNVPFRMLPDEWITRMGDQWLSVTRFGPGGNSGDRYCRRFTASLDAAMSLVPGDEDWGLSKEGAYWIADLTCFDPTDGYALYCRASTPALALTAAALRAHAAIGGE